MNSEKITQIILGGFMTIAVVAIGWFFIESNKQAAIEEALRKNSNNQTSQVSAEKDGEVKFSVDNESDPYKTLNYSETSEKLLAEGEQVFYIGCRSCGHCLNLEKTLKEFLTKHSDKNTGRDLIYKIEAGYACVPSKSSEDFAGYEKIYQFLADNKAIEANDDKAFGTPQFYLVRNGKIIDGLDQYGRTVDGLEKMFATNKYRGFGE